MFFPYGTDAPIYYWPFTTVAMIVICVLVFCAGSANPDVALALSMQIGDGLHPYQWVTSNFVHADFMHILGNMLALWTFGLVVEGKLGWWKTLVVYLGIGVAQCAVEQLLFLGAEPGLSCGASAIIYGMMAMSLIWAPENSILIVWSLSVYIRKAAIPVKFFVGGMVALQLGIAIATKLSLGSALLHLMGAAAGFAVGIWMLKSGRVDCENWDIFSIQAGRHKMNEEQREEDRLRDPEYRRRREDQIANRRDDLLEKIRTLVSNGHPAVAWAAYKRMAKDQVAVVLPEADLCNLINAFHNEKLWADSIPPMAEYLSRFTAKALPMRIKLAKILVSENRPAQAVKVLDKVDAGSLPDNARGVLGKLRAEAIRQHEEDPYEVADEDW